MDSFLLERGNFQLVITPKKQMQRRPAMRVRCECYATDAECGKIQ